MATTKKSSNAKKSTPKRKSTIKDILLDLKEYADKHPEVIAKTKRILNPDDGPVEVDHIPIHKIVQILDEVVVHKHGGHWSERVTHMIPQSNFILIGVDLEITAPDGTSVVRTGTGAGSLYSRNRLTSDSGDNAVKVAHSNAVKKAAFYYEIGMQMWEQRLENKEPEVIDKPKRAPITKGGGKIITSKADNPDTSSSRKELNDKQKMRIREFLSENGLTSEDAWAILSTEIPEAKGDHKWLIADTEEETDKRIDKFIKAMEKIVNKRL